jgi:hypothetical protein
MLSIRSASFEVNAIKGAEIAKFTAAKLSAVIGTDNLNGQTRLVVDKV